MTASTLPAPELPSPDTLLRCLVLALLLHLCLLVWVGNVPGGSAAPGQGRWGRVDSIDVRLGVPGGLEAPAAVEAPPTLLPERGPIGEAATPRQGGAVRDAEPVPPLPTPEVVPGAAQLGDWAPAQRAPGADRDLLPTATAPMPAAAAAPLALPELGRVATPPPVERTLAPDTVARPATAPAAALERITPMAPAPVAPPTALPELAAPPRMVVPPVPAPSMPAIAPPVPVAAPTPVPVPVPTTTAPAASTDSSPTPAPTTATPAGAPAITAPMQSGAGRGAPDAGQRVGPDAATAPSASASSAAPLNLALPRSRGGPLTGGSTPGVLSLLPRPPEKNKLADGIDKSAKSDCRDAYAGAGLLAVVPLVVDAVKKDAGCKW